jgi:hypothetical protein
MTTTPSAPLRQSPTSVRIAWGRMNRPSHRDEGCWSSTETRLFREFFGTSVRVVETVWELIIHNELRPMGGRPEHLLWALYFLKVYPKQGPGYSTVGASNGAIDPKTHRKWAWAFIKAISKLVDVVVSVFDCCVLFFIKRVAILAIIITVHDDDVLVDIIAVHRRHLSSLLPSSSHPPCPHFLSPPS